MTERADASMGDRHARGASLRRVARSFVTAGKSSSNARAGVAEHRRYESNQGIATTRLRLIEALIGILTTKYLYWSPQQDRKIKPETPVINIPQIIFDASLDGYGRWRRSPISIDLCPSR
jgi:hypothetical protein